MHHQQWERVGNALNTFQRVTSGGIEEIMESKPYGLEVSEKRARIPFLPLLALHCTRHAD